MVFIRIINVELQYLKPFNSIQKELLVLTILETTLQCVNKGLISNRINTDG